MPYLGLGLGMQRVRSLFRGLLDQFDGAAAAYSLRKLSSSTTNVVRVRRSSDDTEQDFTANQVSDGSLVDFTGRENQVFPSNAQGASNFVQGSVFGVSNYPTKTDNVSDPFGGTEAIILVYSGSVEERFGTNVTGNNGLVPAYTGDVTFSFWGRVPSGTLTVRSTLRSTGTPDTSNKDHNFTTTWQRFEHTSSRTEANGATGFYFNSSTARTIEIYGVQMERASSAGEYQETTVGATGDGFVTKWYDQSGNSRDATQATTTAQPQIVSGGGLILQNSNPSLSFDGNDDNLSFSNVGMDIANMSSFFVYAYVNGQYAYALSAGTSRWYLRLGDSGSYGALDNLDFNSANAYGIYTQIGTSGAGTAYFNGTLKASNNPSASGISGTAYIGSNGSNACGSNTQELIVYASSKSSDRAAIESNIADAYGITLA